MKKTGRCVLLFLIWGAASGAFASATLEQVITLNPGWNAVHLEVTPDPQEIEAALAGIPVLSVWKWNSRFSTVEFIEDPADGLPPGRNGWLRYFPDGSPEASLTNLFTLRANETYLVRLGGGASVEWRVSGQPRLSDRSWVADSFNLVGFPVAPGGGPTFRAYFAPSAAHADQPIYALSTEGIWELVTPGTRIQYGRAYWVWTEGPSAYQGLLEVSAPGSGVADFGEIAKEITLGITNHWPEETTATVTRLPSSTPVPLSEWTFDEAEEGVRWINVSGPITRTVPFGEERFVPLAVRRADMTEATAESIVSVGDGRGNRIHVLLRATQPALAASGFRRGGPGTPEGAPALAGLWVGNVNVDKVSEPRRATRRVCACPSGGSFCPVAPDGSLNACETYDGDTICNEDGSVCFNSGDSVCPNGLPSQCALELSGRDVPAEARREFAFRVLMHVDDVGQARLLQAVTLMFQEGTTVTDPETGLEQTETPGYYVLVANDERLSEFTGVVLRDGAPAGYRVSTAAYAFDGTSQVLTGSFSPGGTLATDLVLEPDFPRHPYRHKYHPDHDNLDENYLPLEDAGRPPEAFEVTRRLSFELSSGEDSEIDTGAGYDVLTGTYAEEVEGMHRHTLFASGSFELQRVSTSTELVE